MQRKTAVLLVVLALIPATTLAQDRGTQAEQEACTPDVFRLCSDFIPDEGPILACLQAKHAQLSAVCEPVIFPHPAKVTTAPRRHRRRHQAPA